MRVWSLRKLSFSSRVLHHIRANKTMYRLSIAVALLTLFVGWLELSWTVALLCTFIIYLASGGWRFIRVLYSTFPRDFRSLFILIKILQKERRIRRDNLTVGDMFQETVQKYSNKVAFMFEDKQWTFKEVDVFSNRVANYFQSIGYKKGDVVALFMENRPELVFFWLGLSKIGVVASLVNYNLRKESLSHCISIVKSKGLIYSTDPNIADAVADIHSSVNDIELFEFGAGGSNGLNAPDLLEKLKECSEEPPAQIYEKSCNDILFYIYTSGTTGLPKASVIRHMRFFAVSIGWNTCLNIGPTDVLYCVLPLYHTAAGILGINAVVSFGACVVIRRKFSASRFWDECIRYKATGTQYIGELCRYLLAQPPKETDKGHALRWMSGNGLRPQIWKEFKARFNIPLIGEFYGATEGNCSMMNIFGYPGAIGFIPVLLSKFYPIRILRMEPFTEELSRGPDGFCIQCKPGEVGHIVGMIDEKSLRRSFDGYVSKTATANKIAYDVFKKGDKWFLTGDAVVLDELNYVYFHDRLGDTFRWRGENVSTAEVEGVMANQLGLNAAVVVFGVELPGCEGRAGMAVIEDPHGVIDIKRLGSKLPDVLPSYARPVFLRITNSVDTTGTFKLQKSKLRREGFNLSIVNDKLFYLDQKSGDYRVLSEDIFRKFQDGEMHF